MNDLSSRSSSTPPAGDPPAAACLADEPTFGSYFVSTYPPFSQWRPAHLEAFATALDRPATAAEPELILYVHLPFCAERCRFCYYLSHDDRGGEVAAYLEALRREAALIAARPRLADRRPAVVYVGGGTPSLLSLERLEELFTALQGAWSWDATREVTFECAPRSVTAAKMHWLRDGGVTRLSLGVQQLDDVVLERSGRIHRVADVESAWQAIQGASFPIVNVDLMVGMVGESPASFAASLDRVVRLGPDSITIYQLEIPLNTPLYRDIAAGREPPPAPWEEKRRRLAEAFGRLDEAGFHRISAYTAVRDPVRHAFLYQDLQYRGADLLGLGVSAFSYLGGVHQQNEARLDRYMGVLSAGRLPWGRAYPLDDQERQVRELVLQLKLGSIDRADYRERHGVDPVERFGDVLREHEGRGLLRIEERRITVTNAGLPRVDRLLPSFYLPRHQGVRYS